MDRKAIFGMVLFGSLWGMLECTIGDIMHDSNLPAGAIMTGLVAIGLMGYSRMIFKQRGMQLGMGLIAGGLRLINPFAGCFICSAIAIAAEGAIFELIWYGLSEDMKEVRKTSVAASLGVVSAYICYVGGYTITQVLTPLVSCAGFSVINLISFLPQIFSRGLLAGLIGVLTIPLVNALRKMDINRVRDSLYYPITASVALICWLITIVDTITHMV